MTVLISIGAFSQEKSPAIISGTIKDADTRLPLPEAVVTLKSDSFKGEKYTITDSTGVYRVSNLNPGTYSITFEMEGYQKFLKDNIVLTPGMSLGVSFEMIKERKKVDGLTGSKFGKAEN
jgi:archaellin